jgi:hypothetical protein
VSLWRAYTGETTVDDLIRDQEHFLRGLARYALRFQTAWYTSDEDDLFQEACLWLVRALWDWDEDKGKELAEYVVWNIGARLGNQIKSERAERRHPDANHSRKIDIWGFARPDGTQSLTMEAMLAGRGPNPELAVAIREALTRANEEMTDLARTLMVALIENDGNLAGAARDLLQLKEIVNRFGPDERHLKYVLRRRVMPEIFDNLSPTHIMPEK